MVLLIEVTKYFCNIFKINHLGNGFRIISNIFQMFHDAFNHTDTFFLKVTFLQRLQFGLDSEQNLT